MSQIVTFILSNITSFQLYVPLFKIYKEQCYNIKLLIRKNIRKPYICPIGRESEYQIFLKEYDIKIIKLEEWLNNGGITYCVDGDISSFRYLSYIESYIVTLIAFLEPKERQKFLIISLLANTDYIWVYSYYINLVDYVIMPHKDYLFSFYSYNLKTYNKYQESIKYNKSNSNDFNTYQKYLEEINYNVKFPILDNILKIQSEPIYNSPQLLKPILMNHINSNKNLYIGTSKFDFDVDKNMIYQKYGIPKNTKIAVIFHPEHKYKQAYKKYTKLKIRTFFISIQNILRSLGYFIIIKDRLKDMIFSTGQTHYPRKLTGDLHIYNPYLFPNPSIELLYVADIAVIFSSSAIEELFYTNTTIIDIKVDDVDRHNFLRGDQNCYLIDTLPDNETFINTIKHIEDNKQNGIYNKYIEHTTNTYFPVNQRPYSKHIYNTIKYIYDNSNDTDKINDFINNLHKNINTDYIDNKIKQLDNEIFTKYPLKNNDTKTII